jgi:hypothetical protein
VLRISNLHTHPPQPNTRLPKQTPRLPDPPGAWILDNSTCPPNYPEGAPVSICGHVALIELDAKQAYKHAAAYAATRDARHAEDALRIIRAWASANKEFGIRNKNGPLEAGW